MRFLLLFFLIIFTPYISLAVVCSDYGEEIGDIIAPEGNCTVHRILQTKTNRSVCSKTGNPFTYGWLSCTAYNASWSSGNTCGTGYTSYGVTEYRYILSSSSSCTPAEPDICSNGTKDADEQGIDCGGFCSAPCIEACPPGSSIEMRAGSDGLTLPYCIDDDSVPAAPGGACPPAAGDVIRYLPNSDGTCSPWVGFPMLSASGDGDGLVPAVDVPDPADAWLPTPGNETTVTESPPQVVTNPDGSTTETASKTEVTKSPDGTQIATTGSVATTTNSDGSKSTVETKDTVRTGSDGSVSRSTTTTTSSYDSGGNLIGKSTSTVKGGDGSGVYDPDEVDASNYSPVAAAGVPDGIGDQIGSLLTDFSNNIKDSPVFSLGSGLFAGPPSSSSSPVTILDFGSYGEFSFDLSEYDSALNVLGMIFVFMSFFAGLKLITVNKG